MCAPEHTRPAASWMAVPHAIHAMCSYAVCVCMCVAIRNAYTLPYTNILGPAHAHTTKKNRTHIAHVGPVQFAKTAKRVALAEDSAQYSTCSSERRVRLASASWGELTTTLLLLLLGVAGRFRCLPKSLYHPLANSRQIHTVPVERDAMRIRSDTRRIVKRPDTVCGAQTKALPLTPTAPYPSNSSSSRTRASHERRLAAANSGCWPLLCGRSRNGTKRYGWNGPRQCAVAKLTRGSHLPFLRQNIRMSERRSSSYGGNGGNGGNGGVMSHMDGDGDGDDLNDEASLSSSSTTSPSSPSTYYASRT